jgi:uncharacterized protein involved in exopolysaccharide biosynthesis
MADFTGLNQAIADVQAEVLAVVANMDKLLADLKAATPTDQPTLDAATAALEAEVQKLKAAVTTDMAP